MLLDFEKFTGTESYQWLVQLVIPRPIGWVSTIDEQGRSNLAPFSWFQTVSSAPPLLMIAAGYKKNEDGELVVKDTIANARATGECVIHLVEAKHADAMVQSSKALPHGDSEFALVGFKEEPSLRVKPPRVPGARVAFECKLEEILVREHWKTQLLFARVVCAHVDDELVLSDEKTIAQDWSPISRLGGIQYAPVGKPFEIKRPV